MLVSVFKSHDVTGRRFRRNIEGATRLHSIASDAEIQGNEDDGTDYFLNDDGNSD